MRAMDEAGEYMLQKAAPSDPKRRQEQTSIIVTISLFFIVAILMYGWSVNRKLRQAKMEGRRKPLFPERGGLRNVDDPSPPPTAATAAPPIVVHCNCDSGAGGSVQSSSGAVVAGSGGGSRGGIASLMKDGERLSQIRLYVKFGRAVERGECDRLRGNLARMCAAARDAAALEGEQPSETGGKR
jgi:hypothetical protein